VTLFNIRVTLRIVSAFISKKYKNKMNKIFQVPQIIANESSGFLGLYE
jgi:hypothetical protein